MNFKENFYTLVWYRYIVFSLNNLQRSLDFDKAKAISLKLKDIKYCIY